MQTLDDCRSDVIAFVGSSLQCYGMCSSVGGGAIYKDCLV